MEEKKYSITVENLHISYRTLHKTSIRNQLFKKREKENKYFEAVKGISFQVEEGKILGIIGKNGSGKSTTLRAIAGIFSADQGTIDLHGHSLSLLAIGVGFQKELTGRENIFLSGLLLGFDEAFIKEKEKSIIEFSELGEFIDKPVKTYSSGMHSKLAFAITVILETDIMLIDEVLSVGDHRFKKKSYRKMKSLIEDSKRTVIIVSHNIRTLRELCTDVMWMNEGEIVKIGDPDEILDEYIKFMEVPKGLFDDVKDSEKPEFNAIYWGVEKGYISGVKGTNQFKPEKKLSVVQFLLIIWRFAGRPLPQGEMPFEDLEDKFESSSQKYQSITWAQEEGIIEADEDGGFDTDKIIEKADALRMLWKYDGKTYQEGTLDFEDLKIYDQSSEIYQAVLFGVNKGLIDENQKEFKVNEECSRAELITYLYNYSKDY